LRVGEREEGGNEKKPCTHTWPLEKGYCDAFNAVTKGSICLLIDVVCAAQRIQAPPRH
jgi:hypothetical protein